MSFRDESQRSKCCLILCRRMPSLVPDVWTLTGPGPRAVELLEPGNNLSDGERVMLAAVWDIWNGHGHSDLSQILHTLDSDHLASLGGLIAAVGDGPENVDDWIEAEGYCSARYCLEEADDRYGLCAGHVLAAWPDDEPIPFVITEAGKDRAGGTP